MGSDKEKRRANGKDIFIITVALGMVVLLIIFLVLVSKEQDRKSEQLLQLSQQDEASIRTVKAQDICINEVCGDGWIELYNKEGSAVDVSGYQIVCGDTEKTLPDGTTIGRREFLAVELPVQDKSSVMFYGTDGVLYDSIYISSIGQGESYARSEDGGISFAYLYPSKEKTNSREEQISKKFIYFSVPSGFYEEDIHVEIMGMKDAQIYYTLDGSEPGTESKQYGGEILVKNRTVEDNVYSAIKGLSIRTNYVPSDKVEKCTVIRAVAIDKKGKKSDEIFSCYWIASGNKIMYSNMPVISICSEPEKLFGYEGGLYSRGRVYEDALASETAGSTSANYYVDYEAEAYVHYFNEEQVQAAEGAAVLQTYKDGYLDYIQKSLLLRTEGRSCLLSAGKADYTLKIRDMVMQDLLGDAGVPAIKVQPCTVFLDGEYWGVYLLYQPEEFVTEMYADISCNDIACMVGGKNKNKEKQKTYEEFYKYVVNSDFRNGKEYDNLKERMDIQSYLDCYCAHIYIADSNWMSGNEIAWHEFPEDGTLGGEGKWRYVFYGADSSMGNTELSTSSINTYLRPAIWNDSFFYSLLRNQEFKQQFVQTMEKYADEIFSADGVEMKIRNLAEKYKRGIQASHARFSGNLSEGSYEAEVNKIIDFFQRRKDFILKYTQEFVDMEREQRNPEEDEEGGIESLEETDTVSDVE